MKTYNSNEYDVIVVGAGHAGCEAALAAARMGEKTLLLTINLDMVAFMPCNPSVGGPAKGTVVREVDALGGQMGKNIDATYVQMRMLNTGKGPAVRALRAQADKWKYHEYMKNTIENTPNLTLRQGMADELIVEEGICKGLITNTGAKYLAKSVVLTPGTATRGRIIIGELTYSSGPNNSLPSIKLAENLEKLGFKMRRFKTGTPPRVDGNTIDYSKTEEEPGDKEPRHFSYTTSDDDYLKDQLSCYMTYTNPVTHEIIRKNLDRAPMFSGVIKGVGPRYCPSIESKIVRFADKDRHQIFLEPEGWKTREIYVGDFSTSMPEEVQLKMLHSVAGLEKAEMMRPGYAIEYDVIEPWQLKHTLETKNIRHLFTAGQMNGTSGYEEAAGQGLIAGINAALSAQNKPEFVLGRDEAYIGVLIDDLVTKGTNEPYRLLTSRAEYRLLLRHDNADLRLTEKGYNLGLISEERYQEFLHKKEAITTTMKNIKSITIHPTEEVQNYLKDIKQDALNGAVNGADFLKRPRVTFDAIEKLTGKNLAADRYVKEQVEIALKYEGYIKKEKIMVDRLHRLESKKIPEGIDYAAIPSLATEARQKFEKIRPESIAQAERISGVNPADLAVLTAYIQQGRIAKIK
ncbi:MAG: tRNA uridine-5-carboxymethylaminomethyl(34) synthesis enzyme MnmG [Lactobacillus iners]|jgi:tRNA uridine 5-carboxymethylaminomethyl modification enzyme gidA|uniref:tRNA uridine-5-carboxymethylaminomethyl(34) synthesis enzyme MnmG n=1 Tax=Lactobacillus iners TaxID=147802 RepID=UPI0001E5DEBA|nr:tRNA uridine-5-carboxymethylaminomethyl(34) synthesis enzyme MnmG [Lactobacillus iners]EFO69843.1 tRNA uridine 5-carboxymethylaminomethyl modification enzyme GidA [Lactobacillus iners LactinV 03V1-b]EFQ49564.1 tRNA uridine 5-carboxymethylaminomethyl modification enzyme GidA [Lactobacillus iners LEAF 2052A-d]MCT7702725.1 tRNA uridine-5-carboxymethylaminomethyl(34) synthesis enzyme MnmG [Lactobacillus iners]MCT7723463.1 tRNA uridine-5-carboxymethylaminomethyl(34) synthesis enzyme MnmG [Lactoba